MDKDNKKEKQNNNDTERFDLESTIIQDKEDAYTSIINNKEKMMNTTNNVFSTDEVNDALKKESLNNGETAIIKENFSEKNKNDASKNDDILKNMNTLEDFNDDKTGIIDVVGETNRDIALNNDLPKNDEFESIKNGVKNKRIHKRKKSSKKKKIIILSIIAALILIFGIVFGVYVFRAGGNIKEAVLNAASDIVGDQDPIFVLILGVSEDIKVELSDTIILAGYNPDTQKAFMISIPRDTFVGKNASSANGYDKINARYQKGVEESISAVEKLTGVNIDYYVVVKNTAIPALVDAVGEVEFEVPIDMDYDDPTQNLHIHLKKGMQMIDRDKAEQLLRFRHNNNGTSYPVSYGDNDYGRMRTQREFIKVVAKNLIEVNNVSELKNIVKAAFSNIETNITLGKATGYVPHALKFNIDELRMEQLPGQSALINELWFYQSNSKKTKELMDELIFDLGMTDAEVSKYYNEEIDSTKVIESKSKPKNETTNEIDLNTMVDRSNNHENIINLDPITFEEPIKENKITNIDVPSNKKDNSTSNEPSKVPDDTKQNKTNTTVINNNVTNSQSNGGTGSDEKPKDDNDQGGGSNNENQNQTDNGGSNNPPQNVVVPSDDTNTTVTPPVQPPEELKEEDNTEPVVPQPDTNTVP